jgi:hypothetical protein
VATPDLTIHVTDKQLSALSQGIKLGEIHAAIPELEAACNSKIMTSERFADLVKLVALKSGVSAPVLSTYITAVCNDTLKKKQKYTEQLALLFEELGE